MKQSQVKLAKQVKDKLQVGDEVVYLNVLGNKVNGLCIKKNSGDCRIFP